MHLKPEQATQRVSQLEREISEWLGPEVRMMKNKEGDRLFISKDGVRKVRFDFLSRTPP